MNNSILYFVTVLIWGTTWYAIKIQTIYAPAEISILYRAFFSALIMLIVARLFRCKFNFDFKDHIFLCLLGMSIFSLHFLYIFEAATFIISGLVSLVFSCVSFLSIINNYIFFRSAPRWNVICGAVIGIAGLTVFFWHELTDISVAKSTMLGIYNAAIGAVIFSLGGVISKRNNIKGLEIVPSMAMALTYGFIAIAAYTIIKGSNLVVPMNYSYWWALFYLVIAGSVIGYFSYLSLVKNIGPELAGYATVIFPVVALVVSSIFEGYEWSVVDFIGFSLVALGNILIMMKRKPQTLG